MHLPRNLNFSSVIFVLTGPTQHGKTTLLKKALSEIKRENSEITGFLSESVRDNETIGGYDLYDIREDRSFPFIRRTGEETWEQIGPFFFIPETLALAKQIILSSGDKDLCIVDEVGPLEAQGKGFWPALEKAVIYPTTNFLLVIRESILEKIIKKLDRAEVLVFDIRDQDIRSCLMRALRHA